MLLAPTYGFLLSDKFALGGQLSLVFGTDLETVYNLSPYARYYLLNGANLMGYVQLNTNIGNFADSFSDEFTAFQSVTATAGVQLPLGRGALFTPGTRLSYSGGAQRTGFKFRH